MDVGIPTTVEDSSNANYSTDRLGAGPRTKHIDTRDFWVQERVQDEDLSIKKASTAKMCADVGTKPVTNFSTARRHLLHRSSRRPRCRTETETKKLSESVVNIETGAKLSETMGTVEELNTSHDEWTMTEVEERKKRSKQCATSNQVNID